MRCSKILSRTLFTQSSNVKSLSLCKNLGCLLGFHPSPPFSLFSLFLLSFTPPFHLLILPSICLSSFIRLPPAGPHLPLPFGGSRHSFLCPVCPPLKAAWILLPSSDAATLKSFRPSIYCLSLSHDRCLFIPFSMTLPYIE